MQPGNSIVYEWRGTNVTSNGTTVSSGWYNMTVLVNNATHFIIEEKFATGDGSDWVQRRYDSVSRESLTFPGNYSWLWVNTNVAVGATVALGGVSSTVTAILPNWEFRGSTYEAIQVDYSVTNYSFRSYYDNLSTLLLLSNVTKTGGGYVDYMTLSLLGMSSLQSWPSPLTPPAPDTPPPDPDPAQDWGRYYTAPYPDGAAGVVYQRTIGMANVYVYGISANPGTGNTVSDLLTIAGSPFGRADVQTAGLMSSPQFALPECANFQSFTTVVDDGFILYYGVGHDPLAPYAFTHIVLDIHYRHELIRDYPFSVVAAGETVVHKVDTWGWWFFQPDHVEGWSDRGRFVVHNPVYLCPLGTTYHMMAKLFVTHITVASGATFALDRTWMNSDMVSMTIAQR